MKTYVTLADIAARAGVSVMTVSLSLRQHPRIPALTRERIAALAREMGYQPNPMLSSLAAYRQQVRGASYQATVAVISNSLARGTWRQEFPHQRNFWEGAETRGRELGFELEEFWLREPGMGPVRLSRILQARNISGVLLLPQPRARSHMRLAWEHFSPVAFGYSLTRPQVHVAAVNHFQAGVTIMRRLRGLGYRRIGFVSVHEVSERVSRTLLGGYLVEREHLGSGPNPVPPLLMRRASLTQEVFAAWLRQHRPDALFVQGFWPQIVLDWVAALGLRVPDDLGVAFASVHPEIEPTYSGVDENIRMVGAKALELVKAMIDRGEKGIPEIPLRILVEGSWHPGSTVRRVTG